MVDAVRHRGPDDAGVYLDGRCGLGHRRLSIIDLAGGRQPLANEDETVWIVFNGEIYNHVELRDELIRAGHRFRTRSDVETIVHLYEDLGVDCVHRLRGMFAFALWDAPRRRLVLARDRLGIKPLAWARTADGIAFASEFKAILAAGLVEPSLDPAAVEDLFAWGWILQPRTMCAGVERLRAGHVLVFEEGRAEIRRWWAPPLVDERDRPRLTEQEWAEGLLARLEDAVRVHLRSDVPVGAWLSGGVDSSGVAALAARILGRTVDAFSLEFDDPGFDEVGSLATLDRFPGYDLRAHRARHTTEDFSRMPRCVWSAENPVGRGFGSVRQRIAQMTSENVKVALAGEGADEVLGGYWWYKADRRMRGVSRVVGFTRRWGSPQPRTEGVARALRLARAPVGPGPERFRAIAGPLGSENRSRLYSADLARAIAAHPPPQPEAPADLRTKHPVDWLQYWDLTTRMHDYIVETLDRHTMAWSVEIRVPFLDHEVVEWCLAMPPELKQSRHEKRVLRRALANDLPAEILARRKRGLGSPSAKWLRGELPPFAEELLSAESLTAKGWFDAERVARIRAAHRAGRVNRQEQLLSVLQIQTWDEIFLRGRSPDNFDGGAAT
ncbi:MAG TPA: asparagine synthase (glutamine-hydrolyzing), partial [Gemmatimonadota bacterium]|nr:asparagine synthase (glutamine-hydrolyzing) [Gemmatimonadota bacterium]